MKKKLIFIGTTLASFGTTLSIGSNKIKNAIIHSYSIYKRIKSLKTKKYPNYKLIEYPYYKTTMSKKIHELFKQKQKILKEIKNSDYENYKKAKKNYYLLKTNRIISHMEKLENEIKIIYDNV